MDQQYLVTAANKSKGMLLQSIFPLVFFVFILEFLMILPGSNLTTVVDLDLGKKPDYNFIQISEWLKSKEQFCLGKKEKSFDLQLHVKQN